MADINCIVVTPEDTAVDEQATFVALPLFDGEKGVSVNHAPMIGRLGYGELRLTTTEGKDLRFYVDGGFVQIADNVVSIMTNRAVPAKKLNKDQIEEQIKSATAEIANSPDKLEKRDKTVMQARAQLRIAEKNG
jgi:F-type H+-transporting ATPase subunit epsilon